MATWHEFPPKIGFHCVPFTETKDGGEKFLPRKPFYEQNKELFKDFKNCEELKKEIFEKTSEYDARNGGISRERYDKLSTFCRELNLLNDVSELTNKIYNNNNSENDENNKLYQSLQVGFSICS